MNRQEAFQMMVEGCKVKHQYFTSDEYLHMVDGQVYTEDGYYFEDRFYAEDFFEDGWSLVTEDNKKKLLVTCGGIISLVNHYPFATPDFIVEKDEKPWYNTHGNKRAIFGKKK